MTRDDDWDGVGRDRLRALQQRRLRLHDEIKAHAGRQHSWTAADRAKWETMNADYDALMAEIGAERERLKAAAAGAPRLRALGEHEDRLPGGGRMIGGTVERGDTSDLALAGWYRNALGRPVPVAEARACETLGLAVNGDGFEVALASHRPAIGSALRFGGVRNAQSKGTDTAGGYTVPEGFVQRLEAAMKAHGPMIRTSEVLISDDARDAPWPTLDDTANEGSQIAEGAAVADTDLVFSRAVFTPYKFTSGMIKASHELLRDSAINLAGAIGDAAGVRLGRVLNRLATVGSGVGTIEGITVGASVGVTAAGATAITLDELYDLYGSVDPAYRSGPGVGWMMHSDTALALMKLKDAENRYLWEPAPQAGQPPRLLGQPVYVNQAMPTMAASAKTVAFGDLSKYKLRLVKGVRLRTLAERFAEYDQTAFVAFLEADGKLLKPSATASLCPVRVLQMAAA